MRTFRIAVLLGLGATVALVAAIKLHTRERTQPGVNDIASGPGQPIGKWLETLGTGRRFADPIAHAPQNADAFLSLAIGETPPRLAAAALHALATAYALRPQEAARLSKAVLGSLASSDDEVVGAALSTARPLLAAGGDAPVEARVLGLAGRLSHGPGRYALLDALSSLDADRVGMPHIALAQASLQDQAPYVRSRALRFLEVHGEQLDEKGRSALAEAVSHRLTDADPGVRGRAAVVLASLGHATAESLHRLLKDPVPFVKAQACSALARADLHEHLDEVLELTTSRMGTQYDIRDWTTIEGEPGCESHVGSASGLLGEAAATALALLSHGQASIEPIATNDVDGSLRRNRTAVAAWLADNDKTHD